MALSTPKIARLRSLLTEHLRRRLQEAADAGLPEPDYDQLEEELVGAVTKAMMPKPVALTPTPPARQPDPASQDPNQWRPLPTSEAKPLAEDECPTQAPKLPTADPMGQPAAPNQPFRAL